MQCCSQSKSPRMLPKRQLRPRLRKALKRMLKALPLKERLQSSGYPVGVKRLLPVAFVFCAGCSQQPASSPAPAMLDLTTSAGASAVKVAWTYLPAQLVDAPSRSSTGQAVKSLAVAPVPGGREWSSAAWESVAAESLAQPRGPGKVCFAWYRTSVTLPAEVDGAKVTGARVEFECVVDDYAEVWVNGVLTRDVGQKGGTVIAGFNAPNKVLLSDKAKAGDTYEIAVFGINGPISAAPDNYIFFRTARLIVNR
jgi:gluconolactonase